MRTVRAVLMLLASSLLLHLTVSASDTGKPLRISDLPFSAQALIQLAELTASDGASSDELGYSVAVSGSTVAVGTPLASVGGISRVGAVYVFVKPATGWENMTQVAKLTPSDAAAETKMGLSVAISNDTIIAGATGTSNLGPAYVFVKPPGGWVDMTQTAELSPSDGSSAYYFGSPVAISGDTIVVGSSGEGAYIYVCPESGWSNTTQTAKLTSGAVDDFGSAVAIDANTIVVGDQTGNQPVGAAYVFTKPSGGWANTSVFDAQLTASDIAEYAAFGFSVAISGETIVVGAPDAHAARGSTGPGAAYVFVEPANGWTTTTETAELTAGGKQNQEQLGWSVAVSGRIVVAGAPQANGSTGKYQGLAYVFVAPPTGWATTSKYNYRLAAGSGTNEIFGQSVSVSGTTIVSGAPGETVGSNIFQGAAYVFGP